MLQFFVVFHKYIFDDCYKGIPQNILDTYFTFIAVNPEIEKHYTQGKYRIINEWELPIYNPNLQKEGFNENSAIYHIYVNKLHIGYEHIGFLQYDMVLPTNFIDIINNGFDNNPNSLGYCSHKDTYDFLVGSSTKIIMDGILEDYERFYNKKFSTDKLYPICNTYVITAEVYEKIMPWISQIHDKCIELCRIYYPSSRIYRGSVLERAMAMAVGEFVPQLDMITIIHDRELYSKSY